MHFMKQGTWRPLTLGIRMYTSFVPCFYHFLHSPEFTPDFLITMLTSMVEHARHTRLYYTRHKSYFNVSPNWGLMESNGLAHMGILFPEFKEANAERSRSVPEDITLDAREKVWFSITESLANDLNAELDRAIPQFLAPYLR